MSEKCYKNITVVQNSEFRKMVFVEVRGYQWRIEGGTGAGHLERYSTNKVKGDLHKTTFLVTIHTSTIQKFALAILVFMYTMKILMICSSCEF